MRRAFLPVTSLLAATAAPALGQDHAAHAHHAPATTPSACEEEAERHPAIGHEVPEGQCQPAAGIPHSGHSMSPEAMDHGAMDHEAMGHDAGDDDDATAHRQPMDHSQTDHGAAPPAPAPPPPSAGSGPPRAADAIWSAEAMRESRAALRRDHGGLSTTGIIADRFEYRARDGGDGFLWDADGWHGGDINRLWIETEGEGTFGDGVEEADVAILYGRAIGPWFDLQAGVRQDLTGPERTYLDIGIQGLAPYMFEVEADLFLSTKGDLTARIETELDQRITQRLILQPRAELALAAQDVPELGIGAGIDAAELGLRLRYEIVREFAPYVGIEQEWKLGGSADMVRAAGEDASTTNFVAGIRFWF